MLAQKYRFHRRNAVKYVFRGGGTVHGRGMTLRYVTPNRSRMGRYAVVVSKKVSKKAVVRNRIRRRVFEILRGTNERLIQADVVVIVTDVRIATAMHQDLTQAVDGMFRRANLIRGDTTDAILQENSATKPHTSRSNR